MGESGKVTKLQSAKVPEYQSKKRGIWDFWNFQDIK